MVACMTAFIRPYIVLEAAVLTAVVTLSLTLWALTTDIDFTEWGGPVMCFIFMPIVMAQFVLSFFLEGNSWFIIIFSSLFAAMYG